MCNFSVLAKIQKSRREHTKIKSILIWGEQAVGKAGKCQGRRKAGNQRKAEEGKPNRSRKTQAARSQQTTPCPWDNPSIACA